MRTFIDNAGRTWTIAVTIDSIKRVRSVLKFNLARSDMDKMLQELLGDPVQLCDVVFCLIKPEADKLNVSDADFGRSMAGDTIERAAIALLEELADFTPNARDRAQLKHMIAALWKLSDKARDLMDVRMKTDLEAAQRQIEAIFGPSSMN